MWKAARAVASGLFSGGISWWVYAIGGLLVAGVVGGGALYIRAVVAERDLAVTQRDDYGRAAAATALTHEIYKQDTSRALSAARREATAAQARAARSERLLQGVLNAKAEDDGPVAPVLRHVLDGLRGSDGAAAGTPGGAPAGTGADAGRAGKAGTAR